MKYLTLIPDYTSSCLKEDSIGYINIEDLGLPQSFTDRLLKWHESYRKIIPLGEDQRSKERETIMELDKEGLLLAKEMANLITGGAKVKYFSEGLMRYIPVI